MRLDNLEKNLDVTKSLNLNNFNRDKKICAWHNFLNLSRLSSVIFQIKLLQLMKIVLLDYWEQLL
jgi:hypothetical protein